MIAAIIMDNGFEELEAMGPIALLRRAGIQVDVIRVEGYEVTGRFNVTYSLFYSVNMIFRKRIV